MRVHRCSASNAPKRRRLAHGRRRLASVEERAGIFTVEDHRLVYTEYGEGRRVTVLIHGLLFSQRMHEVLARALAERGNRVVTVDLLGHGRSDRPRDMW